jgi:hypothetical protein
MVEKSILAVSAVAPSHGLCISNGHQRRYFEKSRQFPRVTDISAVIYYLRGNITPET